MILGILRDAFETVFPRVCHICEAPLGDEDEFVCLPCLATLPRTGYHLIRNNRFEERFAGKFPFDRGTSFFFYDKDGDVATLVHDFKYHGFSRLARAMGRVVGRELYDSGFFDGIDIIVPIGMHYTKRWKRGYNQAALLGEGIADILNRNRGAGKREVEVWDCLEMRRIHFSQTKRSEKERMKSVRNLFRVKKGYDLTGLTVLLVDDICTTGSTMTAAAEVLNTSTAKIRLRLLTLASTY